MSQYYQSVAGAVGTPVSPTNGGTGLSNPTAHTLLVAEGASPMNLIGPGTAGQVVISGGAGVDPAFSTATYLNTTTAYNILCSTATNVVGQIANGTTGQVLTATTGALPSWQPAASSGIPTIGSSTNNGIVTWNGTTGSAVNSTAATVSSTGIIQAASGLVGGPGYAFTSDATTGIYLGGGLLRFAVGGVNNVSINSSGTLNSSAKNDFTSSVLVFSKVGQGGTSITLTTASVFGQLLSNTAARAVSLSSLNNGQIIYIKDTAGTAGTANITITPTSGTIDGAANYVINTNYGSAMIQFDGTNYWVIANK